MFKSKYNKILMNLLIVMFVFNVLAVNVGTTKTTTSSLKVGSIDVNKTDSILEEQGSSCMLIDSSNYYGHPHLESFDKLAKAKTQVYRTDLHRKIAAKSNSSNITINKKTSPIKINAPPIIEYYI